MSRSGWVREVPDSFTRALVRNGTPRLDVERARRQHAEYCDVLRVAGYDITALPPDERFPDSPFIEDAVVLVGKTALITRPGAPSRRGETEAIRSALAGHHAIATIEPPGTLDGGDVLQMGDRIYAGQSTRTNDAGIAQLRALGGEQGRTVIPVDVAPSVLHLKSAVARLDEATVLVAKGGADVDAFADYRILYQHPGDPGHTSVLCLADGRLLVTASAAGTIEVLERAGYDVTTIDVSEFQAADGGLTCLSVLA